MLISVGCVKAFETDLVSCSVTPRARTFTGIRAHVTPQSRILSSPTWLFIGGFALLDIEESDGSWFEN
jgi:hypothetical protein